MTKLVEHIYRAKLNNGIILECTDFKTLYRCALRECRDYVGERFPGSQQFKSVTAELTYGILTSEMDGKYTYSEYEEIRDYGTLYVSIMSVGLFRDDVEYLFMEVK